MFGAGTDTPEKPGFHEGTEKRVGTARSKGAGSWAGFNPFKLTPCLTRSAVLWLFPAETSGSSLPAAAWARISFAALIMGSSPRGSVASRGQRWAAGRGEGARRVTQSAAWCHK